MTDETVTLGSRTSDLALWQAERIADRCHTRLQEAADALSNGHTEHVGWRMAEVGIPVGNAHSLLSDWMGGYPSDTAENLAGTIFTPVWMLDYVKSASPSS